MKSIGKHFNTELIYFDLKSELKSLQKYYTWILLLIGNSEYDKKYLSNVFEKCILFGPSEFRSQGIMGENLHLLFDMTMVDLEDKTNQSFININTTGDNETNLENAIWECIFANLLPDDADLENVKVLISTYDDVDYSENIKSILDKISSGWIPEQ